MTSSYTPPSFSEDKIAKIIRDRQSGLYVVEDTYNEALVCVRQMDENPGDKVFTLLRKDRNFSVYNTNEFLSQVKEWKKQKVVILKCNIVEIECGAYGKAWLFTITLPKKLKDITICPLALSFGVMVSGFSYISKDKSLVDLVWEYLGSKV